MASIVAKNPLPDEYKMIRVRPPIILNFDLLLSEGKQTLTPAITAEYSSLDKKYAASMPAIVGDAYTANYVVSPHSIPIDTYIVESSVPSVAEIVGNQIIYKTTGQSTLIVTGKNLAANITKSVSSSLLSFTSATEGSNNIIQYLSPIENTVRYSATSAIQLRTSNKYANSALRIFTSQNHTTQTYVRNTNCWAYDLDLTCISNWNSSGGGQKTGTLITPRHIIFAAHFQLNVGDTVRFVKKDNTVINRTLSAKKTHPSYSPYFPDITIGVLDSDVDSGITFAKVLPDTWQTYLPTGISDIPTLALDQEKKALINIGNNLISTYTTFSQPKAPFSHMLQFYEAKIGGDSGSPAFLIINNQLVLLTVWTFGGAGSGTSITYFKPDINQLIKDVDSAIGVNTGYSLTDINLTGFKTF